MLDGVEHGHMPPGDSFPAPKIIKETYCELAYGCTSFNVRGLLLDGWMPSSLFLCIAESVGCAPESWSHVLCPAFPTHSSHLRGEEILYPLLQVMHCNVCDRALRPFYLCRLEPHIVPFDTPMLQDGTYKSDQGLRAKEPNAAFQVGIDFTIPTSYPVVYWAPALSDYASDLACGPMDFIPIPYCNMLFHLRAEYPGESTSEEEWQRPCLALPTKVEGWWKWFHKSEALFTQPIELLDNVVLCFGEQATLLGLLSPLRQELIQLYKEDTLGNATFNGWTPSTIFCSIVARVTVATSSQLVKALSTNLYDPQPTVRAALQAGQVPLIQCFVYKRGNQEFYMARLHPLLRDPAGVKHRDGYYMVAEDFFF